MPMKTLSVGDAVIVGGDYELEPAWTAAHREGYRGRVTAFAPGQNERCAAVIELDDEVLLEQGAGRRELDASSPPSTLAGDIESRYPVSISGSPSRKPSAAVRLKRSYPILASNPSSPRSPPAPHLVHGEMSVEMHVKEEHRIPGNYLLHAPVARRLKE